MGIAVRRKNRKIGVNSAYLNIPRPTEASDDTSMGLRTGRYLAGVSQGPWISQNVRTARLPDGYVVEAFIVGADLGLWTWRPNSRLGFNLAADFVGAASPRGEPCTTEVGQHVLEMAAPSAQCDGSPWCDARSFCVPALRP